MFLQKSSIMDVQLAAKYASKSDFLQATSSFQPLTIITKRSILDVAAALDPLTIITKRSILDVTAALDLLLLHSLVRQSGILF